jgi:hypothetical protein
VANIKQIIPCEPGWDGVYVRDDATYDLPVKSTAAPIVGWALIDDENGESAVHALLSIGGAVTTSLDLAPRYLGAARPGSYGARLADEWEPLAQGYLDEYGEPGAQSAEGEEGAEGEAPAEGEGEEQQSEQSEPSAAPSAESAKGEPPKAEPPKAEAKAG